MTLTTKILIWVGGVLLVSTLGFIVYKQIEISTRQQAIEANVVAQKQLVDGIVRSQATWATKGDVDNLIKNNGINLQAIQNDLDKLHAAVSSINVAVAVSTGQHAVNVPTTSGPIVNPNPIDPANPDPYGYMSKQQQLALNEDFGTVKVPFGSVGFSAWQKDPWNYDVKSREYHLNTVVGTDENQRQYYYNKFVVKVDGKDYEVPIKTATTSQVYPTAKFSWWNPRLFVGADGGVNISQGKGEFTPSASIGIMSYGRYKTQPDFSILEVGAGYGTVSKKAQLVITPITYNIGKHIPLMNNTYIGPSLSIGAGGDISLMGGIRVGL
jgi:hypothetical protein